MDGNQGALSAKVRNGHLLMKTSSLLKLFPAVFLFLAGGTSLVRAETFTLELMAGTAYNFPTPLTIHQNGYPDLQFTANYDTKPFGPFTPYYSWRASLWEGNQAWEIQQVHHRLFLTNPPPEVQYFSIHYGYNYILLGHAWKYTYFTLHTDIGPIFTNPQNTVRGQVLFTYGTGIFDQGYDFSGVGAQVAVSRAFRVWGATFVVADIGLIGGWAWTVPVANGSADVPTLGIHFHLGTGIGF